MNKWRLNGNKGYLAFQLQQPILVCLYVVVVVSSYSFYERGPPQKIKYRLGLGGCPKTWPLPILIAAVVKNGV